MHHKYKKQSGGKGQYGDVWLEIAPLERGKEFDVVEECLKNDRLSLKQKTELQFALGKAYEDIKNERGF